MTAANEGAIGALVAVALALNCASRRETTTTGVQAHPLPPGVLAPAPHSVDEVAAEVVKRVNERDGAGVHALYGERMRAKFPEDGTRRFVSGVADAMGPIAAYDTEAAAGKDHISYRLHGERADGRMDLAVGRDGRITLLRITVAPAEPPITRNTTPLALPFRGQWFVDWGGDTAADNHHVGHGSQRRAADLVMRGADGKTHRGDGKTNDDYLAYGADVLAVADGTVTAVVDGVAENVPGVMNRYAIFGNVVTIRHTDWLYSVYAHLQPGKLRVKTGANVKAGTVIAACGNSGNSSEPHLHFQLQDGPRFEDSWGVEAVFAGVLVVHGGSSEKVPQYVFHRGDLVGDAL